MRESVGHLAMLKAELAIIAGGGRLSTDGRIATGHEALDRVLGGGLARGRVHELFAASSDDAASATGFAAMLALRAVGRQSPIFWLRTDASERFGGRLHAPGLVELGGDPGSLVLGQAPDVKALLRAAADAARCPGLSALIVETHGKCPVLDLTASRRLALAVEQCQQDFERDRGQRERFMGRPERHSIIMHVFMMMSRAGTGSISTDWGTEVAARRRLCLRKRGDLCP